MVVKEIKLYLILIFLFFVNVIYCQPLNDIKIDKTDLLIREGKHLWEGKKRSQSIEKLLEAYKLLKESEQWEKTIFLGIDIGNKNKNIGRYQASLEILNEINSIFSQLPTPIDSLQALVFHKIGVANFFLLDSQEAILNYKKALNIREKLYKRNHPDIIRGYHNIGGCFEKIGSLDSALHYLNISLNKQSSPPTEFISDTYHLLGRVQESLGNFQQAENFFLLTLEEYKEKYENRPWRVAELLSGIAMFFYQSGFQNKALLYFNESTRIYLQMEDKYLEDFLALANNYNNLGLVNLKYDSLDLAIENFNHSKDIGDIYWKRDSKDIAEFYTNLGITYKRKKDFKLASSFLKKALDIYIINNNVQAIADIYHNTGDVFFEQKKYSKALENYHLSILHNLPSFQQESNYINPTLKKHYAHDKRDLLIFLEAKAKTFKALYDQNNQEKDLIAAHQTYQLLDELIDDIRLSYLEDASKSYLVKQAKPIYEKAIGICLQYHQYSKGEKYLAEAFKYAEKSKAIILLEQIKESRANIAGSIPDSVRQKERQLKKAIGQIEKELALQGEEVTIDSLGKSLREQLIRVKNEYEDLVKHLEKNNEEYHQLKYDLQTVDIPTIQQAILKEGQQLVEYFVGVDSMYLFSIGEEKFEVIAKPLDFDLKGWTDSLRQGIYYCRINSEITTADCQALDRQYEQYAAKLYQRLIAPLNLREETKGIIFIPDGVLGYIPFDALLSKAIPVNQQNQFQNYPYFGLEKVMSYAFSATFLKELQQTVSTIDNHQLLAFAPSFKVGIKEGVTLKVTLSEEAQDPILALRSSLSPLLFNEREVEQIEANFSGKSYISQQANKVSFIQEAPNYRYLHIASHGKMNDVDADLSYIAFTQNGDSTNQDELLYLRELYDMDIPADMVVLSACETGIGELQNGEGIISLARGFSYAGAKSIITSLWSVNDQKTTDLMVDFYQNLKEGETKAYALANAKRDYISTQKSPIFSHPFYWAGFIPIGNMESVQAATDWTWFVYGLFGMSLLAGFIFWQSKRTKRKSPPIAA